VELVIAIVGFILAALVGEQAIASAPAIARWIVQRAVLRLPEGMRERYSEERLRVVEDVPGPLLKLWSAVGVLISTGALIRHRAGKELVAESSGGRRAKKRETPKIFVSLSHGTYNYFRIHAALEARHQRALHKREREWRRMMRRGMYHGFIVGAAMTAIVMATAGAQVVFKGLSRFESFPPFETLLRFF
jgi:hypothetical protein